MVTQLLICNPPSHDGRVSTCHCSTGANKTSQARNAGQEAVCFREVKTGTMRPTPCLSTAHSASATDNRPRASGAGGGARDDPRCTTKNQLPLVQNKVTLFRTIPGMSFHGPRLHDVSSCTFCRGLPCSPSSSSPEVNPAKLCSGRRGT
jgi:hypothetical protein